MIGEIDAGANHDIAKQFISYPPELDTRPKVSLQTADLGNKRHARPHSFYPILLIDEAQEMSAPLLAELRLLGSTKLDTCTIINVVLCGDRASRDTCARRTSHRSTVGSRARLVLEAEVPENLGTRLRHIITTSGNPALMTDELQRTLCEHAAGNRRVLMNCATSCARSRSRRTPSGSGPTASAPNRCLGLPTTVTRRMSSPAYWPVYPLSVPLEVDIGIGIADKWADA